MKIYTDFFEKKGIVSGQILITAKDFEDRDNKENLLNAFDTLFDIGVVPIINENDAVAVDEIKFGDNDMIAANVASMLKARHLFLITGVEGVYDKNPNKYDDAKVIRNYHDYVNKEIKFEGKTSHGTGGMESKVNAAILATEVGTDVNIMGVEEIAEILKIIEGNVEVGTYFKGLENTITEEGVFPDVAICL
ncbi:MAG: hypothetical protein A2X02_04670 [Bacteroidetes bacterium GWF2_29_10]|nr:MAG: hypothetical protein A2X02_04670 [Bacteroidetes bacterium GWF2_29_10]